MEIPERNSAQEGVIFVGINMRIWLINYELEQMSGYLSLIRASLDQRLVEIEAAYREETADELTEREREIMEDHYTDQFLETGRGFPQRLLSSFVVAWYSLVEQRLLDICENLNLRVSIGPKDNLNFRKGIRRARIFLLKASRYEIHPPHWQELVSISWLRNSIVHQGTRIVGSYFPSEEAKLELQTEFGGTYYFPMKLALYPYLKKHDIVEHSSLFLDIIPSYEYCSHLVEFAKQLFRKLHTDLNPSKP